ncbi:hypothetical protein QTO34_019087 [Cnephaeus nilssonii]|uniref:Uncharacterized protein n=1 Tax=Cnephaeus nilssonii TaxID=3371016 RepID=A0AA40LQR7_CNENI|nr:hypothetical protein QTO34_019087 [Eptesicus nilssonii]
MNQRQRKTLKANREKGKGESKAKALGKYEPTLALEAKDPRPLRGPAADTQLRLSRQVARCPRQPPSAAWTIKSGELGACLLWHQAFQKPPPSRRLLKGLVHQRTGTQLHHEKRKRGPKALVGSGEEATVTGPGTEGMDVQRWRPTTMRFPASPPPPPFAATPPPQRTEWLGVGRDACIIAMVTTQAFRTAPATPGLWVAWEGGKVAPAGGKAVPAARVGDRWFKETFGAAVANRWSADHWWSVRSERGPVHDLIMHLVPQAFRKPPALRRLSKGLAPEQTGGQVPRFGL